MLFYNISIKKRSPDEPVGQSGGGGKGAELAAAEAEDAVLAETLMNESADGGRSGGPVGDGGCGVP